MPFPPHASATLLEAVSHVLPGIDRFSDCPEEGLTKRQSGRIRLAVARRLFGVDFASSAELSKYLEARRTVEGWDADTALTQALLPLKGVGENSFHINEILPGDGRISSYVTLRDYDEAEHLKQQALADEEGEPVERDVAYDGQLLWCWARWHDDGLVYGNLSMARPFLQAELEDHVGRVAERHLSGFFDDLVSGVVENAEEARAVEDEDVVDAVIRGAVLLIGEEEARRLVAGQLGDRLTHEDWVCSTRTTTAGETEETILFSNIRVLSSLRLRNWLSDLSAQPDGKAVYQQLFAEGRAAIEEYVEKAVGAVRNAYDQLGSEGGAVSARDLMQKTFSAMREAGERPHVSAI